MHLGSMHSLDNFQLPPQTPPSRPPPPPPTMLSSSSHTAAGVLLLLSALCCCVGSGSYAFPVYPTVMPLPQQFSQTVGGAVALVNDPAGLPVQIKQSSTTTQPPSADAILMLKEAASRILISIMAGVDSNTLPYLRVRLPPIRNSSDPASEFPAPSATFESIEINVESLAAVPTAADLWQIDESYQLDISVGQAQQVKAVFTAKTWVGAMHGLTTLSQLIVWTGSTWVCPNLPISISDAPRFRWRGLLLDTARHYVPVPFIEHVLDGLSMLRMNVLHWHIVDAQSFPFVSTAHPNLSAKGALHPTLIYTHDDVRRIVAYGLARGIRIVPEFDNPGHTASWGFGQPWLTTPCWDFVRGGSGGVLERSINTVSLDVTKPETLPFVDKLLQEVSALFPDPFLHLGGDEVAPGCWNSDPSVVAFMAQHNISDASALQAWFTKQVLQVAGKYNKRPILWEEGFESGATQGNHDTVVNVWTSLKDLPAIKAAGLDALISYGAYLDRQEPVDGGLHWMFMSTWTDMYTSMIAADVPSDVLGGEASSWDENADAASLDERIFHRLPAIAERLWSAATVTDLNDARVRMAELRCKTLRRGVQAGPVFPDYCDVAKTPSQPSGSAGTGAGWVVMTFVFAGLAVALAIVAVVMWRRARDASDASKHTLLESGSERATPGRSSFGLDKGGGGVGTDL